MSARDRSRRHEERLAQGLGAIYSVKTAAALLPIGDTDARRWLHQNGLVRQMEGRPVVCWAGVVEALRAQHNEVQKPEQGRRLVALRRARLDPI